MSFPKIQIRLYRDNAIPFPVRPAILLFPNKQLLHDWVWKNNVDWSSIPAMDSRQECFFGITFQVSYFKDRVPAFSNLRYAVREFGTPQYSKKFHEKYPEHNGLYVAWAVSDNFFDEIK